MVNKTILITGAAGFTGRHACSYFAAQGYQVVGTVRAFPVDLPQSPGLRYVVCDLTDYSSVLHLLEQIRPDYILHLGGKNAVKPSWEQPLDYMETNVMGVFYLLEAIRTSGIKARMVLANSRLRFDLTDKPQPNHPYGLSKSLGGTAALCWSRLYGQDIVIGEPGNLIGPGPSTGICSLLGHYISREEQGRSGPPFRLSSGEEKRDFLDVRDAVRAYELLLHSGDSGVIYPICSGHELTLRDTAASFAALSKVPVRIEEDAQSSLKPGSVEPAEQPEALMKLGFQPSVTWEQSVRDIMAYWRSRRD
jgi:GDP-4-dehydro-6-deoxy-D-mannose reductase